MCVREQNSRILTTWKSTTPLISTEPEFLTPNPPRLKQWHLIETWEFTSPSHWQHTAAGLAGCKSFPQTASAHSTTADIPWKAGRERSMTGHGRTGGFTEEQANARPLHSCWERISQGCVMGNGCCHSTVTPTAPMYLKRVTAGSCLRHHLLLFTTHPQPSAGIPATWRDANSAYWRQKRDDDPLKIHTPLCMSFLGHTWPLCST